MAALIALLKVVLMIIGGLSTVGMVCIIFLALRAKPESRAPRCKAVADYEQLTYARRLAFGPLHDEEDEILYAIGCAKVLGDEDTARRLTSLYTSSIPRKL